MAADVMVVDPRRLPVTLRSRARRRFINVGHLWVLHKRIMLRVVAALMVLFVVVGLYELRGVLFSAAMDVGDLAEQHFSDIGFAIDKIEITGQTLTREQDIFAALALEPKASTLNFDAAAARKRIEAIPSIASATVRKVYPGQVIVTIVEKQPVARWRVDGVTFVVDGAGDQIGEDRGAYGELPLVIGDGAADDALVMIRALDRFPDLKSGLAALSRIGDRRWDMIYSTGLRVQLPETGVGQALVQLSNYQREYQLLDRDVSLIDLRVSGLVALKPVVRETEDDKKKAGAKKKP